MHPHFSLKFHHNIEYDVFLWLGISPSQSTLPRTLSPMRNKYLFPLQEFRSQKCKQGGPSSALWDNRCIADEIPRKCKRVMEKSEMESRNRKQRSRSTELGGMYRWRRKIEDKKNKRFAILNKLSVLQFFAIHHHRNSRLIVHPTFK